MVFNSSVFFIFLAIYVPGFFMLRGRAQVAWSLLFSCIFYGWWDWRFLSLLGISTVVDFFTALYMGRTEDPGRRRFLLGLSLLTNLGMLGFFKYFNFFIDSFRVLAEGLGFHPSTSTLHIILPVGISFYSFQTLSYTIDVYRKHIDPEPSLLKFATFVSFFPQLVAGPIVRAVDFLPQLHHDKRFDWDRVISGATLAAFGFFKKVAVADTLALTVDRIFEEPSINTSIGLIVGVVFYAFQIYCDFSGYSDIAIGLARALGYEFPKNFNRPYISTSFSEFWMRWHISLSSWLRDYLYIPLGGNRNGTYKTYRNLMLTMLLGGLWHGAHWKFVIWGALHGFYLVVQRLWAGLMEKLKITWTLPWVIRKPLLMALVFTLTCLAWIPFRASSTENAMEVLGGILKFDSLNPATIRNQFQFLRGAIAIAILLLLEFANDNLPLHGWIMRRPVIAAAAMAACLWVICLFGTFGSKQFIYFQF